MHGLPKDCRSYFKEYAMICLSAKSTSDAIKLIDKHPTFTLLQGGSDLALKLKNSQIDGIIDISHLKELSYVNKDANTIEIGALTTINTILNNTDINENIAILALACKSFASHQIRNIASLGGNIANDSPVADLIAPLLVLNAKVMLCGAQSERVIPLEELFNGYKSLNIHNELIKSFIIPIVKHKYYYRKVGARANLTITKVSLAMVQNEYGFFISGASINPYIRRFKHLEKLLHSTDFNDESIREALHKDISPSGSYRSTKEYRSNVLFNMINEALKEFTK